jgi:diguanylate cyclase (GGDEF)-like protein
MKQFARPVAPQWNMLSLLAIGLLLSFSFLFSRQVFSFVVGLGFGFLWVLFAFWLFADRGVWIYVINPLLLIFSLFVFSAVFSITIGKREQARLFTLATRDGLTGLYVIRYFQTLLNGAVMEAHKKQQPLSIILLDLDFFKKINDEHGHVAGDVALRYVAENLRLMTQTEAGSGEVNAVGRYGGEEFILMFKKCHLIDAAFNYAEKIRRQFEQNFFSYEGVKISLTVSIGVATLRHGETVPDMMVLRADEALYRAKTEGRNRVCVEKDAGEDAPKKEEA